MIVVTGATGNTGRRIAEALSAEGKKVRAVGRDAKRLKSLVDQGAEAMVGSLDDSGAMTRAFKGADAVFAMIPPNPAAPNMREYQKKVGEVLAAALAKSGVRYVVHLSSVGAHLSEKVGPVTGLYDQEQRLNALKDVHVVHLRPGYFMENLLWNVGLIKTAGINGSPLRADLPIPMIATKDISADAVRLLLAPNFSGKTARELLGQRDLTMAEVTRVIGQAVGKPDLKYVQFPYDEAEKAMLGMGLSAGVAEAYIEMYKAFNDGRVRPTENRSAANTTPTSIEAFSKTIAEAYRRESP